MPPRRKKNEEKPYRLPGGAPPPSWANVRTDQLIAEDKLARIEKAIANAADDSEAVEKVRAILNDSENRDEAGQR